MDPTINDGRALQRLLDELGRLPGIGPKSAARIAYYLLEADDDQARRLASAILEVKQQVHFCPVCFSYATRDTCDVCADASRDRTTICVVSEPRDVTAIEHTGSYHGLYHVLGHDGADASRVVEAPALGAEPVAYWFEPILLSA